MMMMLGRRTTTALASAKLIKKCWNSLTTNGLTRQSIRSLSDYSDDPDYVRIVETRDVSEYLPDGVSVHCTGFLPNGARQYLLLPPSINLEHVREDPSIRIASIFAHHSTVFGARVHTNIGDLTDPISKLCPPLLEAALRDAGSAGLQVEAMSTLHGLSSWVVDCLEERKESEVLKQLLEGQAIGEHDENGPSDVALVQLEAVQAIATGRPRPGHSVLGVGTFQDGQTAWEALAKEFATKEPSDELQLYMAERAELVSIEHLADKNPEYLLSAGGAMARLMFL